ncbi:MAG: VanZ family protein [Psychrobacter glaciei]|jgi:VanZ family protein
MNILKVTFFLCALVLAFIPIKGHLFGYSHLVGKFFDFLHFPFFSILTVLLLGVQTQLDRKKKYRLLILVLLVLFIELIQSFIGRSASLMDILWGGLGIAFGWFWNTKKFYWITGLLSCYAVVLGLNLYILYLAESRLPIVHKMETIFTTKLFDNMNEIKIPRFKTVWSDEKQSQVLKGSKVDFKWSGFSYKFPLYADLKGYKLLTIDYYSPINFSELEIRFNSANGKKMYTLNNINKGWNKLIVKINSLDSSEINWSEITGFAVFYRSDTGPETYLVDNIIFQ